MSFTLVGDGFVKKWLISLKLLTILSIVTRGTPDNSETISSILINGVKYRHF
jgi:hypothetical protein